MVAIDEESTPQEVLQIITEEGFSRIPVYSETVDHIIGVVPVSYTHLYLPSGS